MINTHWHPDHVGSNELIAKSGSTIAGGNVSGAIADAGEGAAVIAHENVLVRMSSQETPPPFEAWPTVTLFMPQKDIFFNGEAVQVLHQPAAHTDGDSLVFFRALRRRSARATSSRRRVTLSFAPRTAAASTASLPRSIGSSSSPCPKRNKKAARS